MSRSSPRRSRRSRRRPPAHRRAACRRRPPAHPLEVRVERRASVLLMHIAGEFDIAGVDQVETALARSIDRRTDHVVFDLRELSFLDLCGLQTLVRADRLARAGSCAVHVVPPPAEVARIFSLTPVGRGLEMLDDAPG